MEISKINKTVPLAFSMYKMYFNVLPRILVLSDMFDLLLPFMDRYFFVQSSFSIVFVVRFIPGIKLDEQNWILEVPN